MELTPTHPLAKAIAYAQACETALRVYLTDPSVAIDTNHVERTLRCIGKLRSQIIRCAPTSTCYARSTARQ